MRPKNDYINFELIQVRLDIENKDIFHLSVKKSGFFIVSLVTKHFFFYSY
jgi:hypothetical protein